MSSTITYLPIFNLNILHNYFLDKGDAEIFDDTEKPEVLSSYNVSDFLRVVPSQSSKKVLKNHRAVFKTTTLGATCFISVDAEKKPVIDVTDEKIDLLIYSKDPSFEKYTDLDTATKGVYFFTNDPEVDNKIDVLDGIAKDLDSYKVLSGTSEHEVLLSTLDGSEQRSLLGIVSIHLNDLLEEGTGAVGGPTEFKIVLKNRKTIWVYLDQDGEVMYQTGTALPFTQKGNITPTDGDGAIISQRMATPFDAFVYPTDTNLPIETQIYI